jgi:NADH:ubiquinone oxidoreductase subunit E
MNAKKTLFICMGSACHQIGVYDVIKIIQQLIIEMDLNDSLELKGSFCLGACAKGIVMKIDDHLITEVNKRNLRSKFLNEVIPMIQRESVS